MLMSAILSNIGLYAGYLATGARPQFQMSRDRLLPRFLGATHKSWGTPWVAILLMGVVNAVLINFNFDALITIDVFLLMFAYVLIYLTAVIMRFKEPDTPRTFRVPMPTWALCVWVFFPIAIAIIALFVNGTDWMIGGLIGVLTGPIAYLIFKNVYKGTTDDALEGSAVVKGQKWANLTAVTGILGGLAAIGGGLYAHSGPRRSSASRSSSGSTRDYLSGVHVLIGLGVIMVIGGLLSFKWPASARSSSASPPWSASSYTFNRGQYRWTPLLLLLGRPVGARLVLRHLRRLRGLQNVPQSSEKLADARSGYAEEL